MTSSILWITARFKAVLLPRQRSDMWDLQIGTVETNMALVGSDTGRWREKGGSREAPLWNATHLIHYYCLSTSIYSWAAQLCFIAPLLIVSFLVLTGTPTFQLQLKSDPGGNELGLCLCRRAAQAGYLFIKALSGSSPRVSITCKPLIQKEIQNAIKNAMGFASSCSHPSPIL